MQNLLWSVYLWTLLTCLHVFFCVPREVLTSFLSWDVPLSFQYNFPLYLPDTQILDIIGDVLKRSCPRPRLLSLGKKATRSYRTSSVRGIVRRSRSINVDAQDVPGRGLDSRCSCVLSVVATHVMTIWKYTSAVVR